MSHSKIFGRLLKLSGPKLAAFRGISTSPTTLTKMLGPSIKIGDERYKKLNDILKDAEKIVNVQPEKFTMQQLLRDEGISELLLDRFDKVASMRQVPHPIVQIARDVFTFSDPNDPFLGLESQTRVKNGNNLDILVLLLLAKLSHGLPTSKINPDITSSSALQNDEEAFRKQMAYIEVFELLDTAMYIHQKAVIDLNREEAAKVLKQIHDGNRLSILGGDYLVSYAISKLATCVRDSRILEMIGSAMDDFCEHNFHASPWMLPSKSMNLLDWEQISGHGSSRLFAYSCQFMPMIAGAAERQQRAAFDFGYNLILFQNLMNEMRLILAEDEQSKDQPLKLVSAPVLLHNDFDRNFIPKIRGLMATNCFDSEQAKREIRSGPALEKCQEIGSIYADKALMSLQLFPKNSAKDSLRDIIHNLRSEFII